MERYKINNFNMGDSFFIEGTLQYALNILLSMGNGNRSILDMNNKKWVFNNYHIDLKNKELIKNCGSLLIDLYYKGFLKNNDKKDVDKIFTKNGYTNHVAFLDKLKKGIQ